MKLNFRRGYFFDARVWALLIPALVVLAFDLPVLLTLLYSLSAILVVVAMAHVMRRVLFHYIDMEEVENRASMSSTGAGLVFLGVCILTSAVVLGAALWIAK